ncbi:MAG TPA: metal transporter [Anaerolineae bacterium]
MTQQTASDKQPSFNWLTAILLILPLILLGGVIALFLTTGGGLHLAAPAPIEALTVERTILKPNSIDIVVRNGGPTEITIAQTIINEAIWPFTVSPSATIPRLAEATVHLDYGWVEGEAYGLTLFSSNAIAFEAEIPVAFTSPEPSGSTFWSFTLIGLYVGIIPVYLGLLWFPALRQLSRRWMIFLLAVTVGLLIFLGIDTLAEAFEQVGGVPGPFQGVGLIGLGAVTTFLLLDTISQRQVSTGRSEVNQRLRLAYMIAIGIGLHNLGEGLAIGAAYNLGEIALGSFLVVGFIIQNITEGLGIIAPVVRDRPGLSHLAMMGLVGGGPAVVGAWLGGFAPSPTLAVLFLAIGAGAIFQVVYEIGKLIRHDTTKAPVPLTVFSGVVAGMLLLWLTGLFVK